MLGNNYQGTGLSASDLASLSADPTQALNAYAAAGETPGG
jgi:hypothetical protein